MKDSNYRISLDIRQTQSQATIPVKTNDTSRKLYISLTDGGAPYIIEEGCFAVLSGTKSDGTTLLNNCIIENNVIRYDFTQQTVSAEGIAECEIILYDADGGLLLSPHITIVVDARAGKASSTISSNEYTFIDEAMTAEAARARVESARVGAESARVAAEQERVAAYRERLDADQAIEDAEDSRKAAEQERVTAENTRDAAERARKVQENERVEAEELRGTSEEIRRANEATRKASEESRVLAEARREIAIETAKAMAIECEASGEFITLNDASNAPLSNLKVFGRTTQNTTTGKNKLPSEAKTLVQNGVTFTANGNGTVTVNGTATDGAEMKDPNQAVFLPAGKYILNGCQGGSNNTYYLLVATINDGGVYERLATDIGNGASFELTTARNVFFILRVLKGVTVSNVVFKPMVRLATETDATYEQYTGGIPSPNPDYPQDLVSVGDSGSFEVGVYGKNLYKNTATTTEVKGIAFTVNGDGSVTANGTATATSQLNLGTTRLPKGNYKATGYDGSISDVYLYIKASTDKGWPTVVGERILTYTEDVNAFFVISIGAGTTVNNLTFYPMIRLATETDSTYEPCNKQSLTMPFGLPSMPNTETRDEVDFNKAVHSKKVVSYTFDGSENWSMSASGTRRFVLNGIYAKRGIGVSSHFTQALDTDLCFWVSGTSGAFTIYDVNGKWADLNAFKSWLTENKPTFLLELDVPTETPLSEAEINAYRQLHTNKPNTIIYNSDSAQQEVTYVADTKTYIDNKFAALTAATEEVV